MSYFDNTQAAIRYLDEHQLSIVALCAPNHGCGSPGKVPHTPNWTHACTELPERDDLLRDMAKWNGNIGIACGIASDVTVIDSDSDKSRDMLINLVPECKGVPHVATGGGGDHFYFKFCPLVDSQDVSIDDAKLEIKGTGRQVVAPPSIHASGKQYTWQTEFSRDALIALPPAFIDACTDGHIKRATVVGQARQYDRLPDNHPHEQFNNSDHYRSILEAAGWAHTETRDQNELWRRPGKEEGHSATFHIEHRIFYVFSSNVELLKQSQGSKNIYWPFTLKAIYEHGGSREEAAAAIREMYSSDIFISESDLNDDTDDELDGDDNYGEGEAVASAFDFVEENTDDAAPTNGGYSSIEESDATMSADEIEVEIKALAKLPYSLERARKVQFIVSEIMLHSAIIKAYLLSALVENGLVDKELVNEVSKESKRTKGPDTTTIAEKYHDSRGTLAYKSGSWYYYNGAKYVERSRDEQYADIAAFMSKCGYLTPRHKIIDVEFIARSKAIEPNDLEMPFHRKTKKHHHSIISLRNGLLDLSKLFNGGQDALMPHTSDIFLLSTLPYHYDPLASCPRWKSFISEAVPDMATRLVMQEFYGLALTDDQDFHAFLFLQGESRTGKGVAFSVLQALVGKDNIASVPLREFGTTFGLQPMLGKKLNINAEIPELDKVAEDRIKEYVGGDLPITYNRKNQPSIVSHQRARLVFSSNNYPNFKDRSEGLWNRMKLIRFNIVPERQDLKLGEYLTQNELAGIFNWSVDGYIRLMKNQGFTQCEKMSADINDYRNDTDHARRFAEAHLEIGPFQLEDLQTAHSKTLYKYYMFWAKSEGHYPLGAVNFGRSISKVIDEKGGLSGKNEHGTFFVGVKFSSQARQRIIDWAVQSNIIREDNSNSLTEDDKYDRITREKVLSVVANAPPGYLP